MSSKRCRVIKACDCCRLKKTKCNGETPCEKCVLNNVICTYTERVKKERVFNTGHVEFIESKMNVLTTALLKLSSLIKQEDVCQLQQFAESITLDSSQGYKSIQINQVLNAINDLTFGEVQQSEEACNNSNEALNNTPPASPQLQIQIPQLMPEHVNNHPSPQSTVSMSSISNSFNYDLKSDLKRTYNEANITNTMEPQFESVVHNSEISFTPSTSTNSNRLVDGGYTVSDLKDASVPKFLNDIDYMINSDVIKQELDLTQLNSNFLVDNTYSMQDLMKF